MTSKPKLNQPDVESTITSPIGESLNINYTIPSKQFEQVFEKDTNIEKRNLTLEEVKKEWEDLGYIWIKGHNYICLRSDFDELYAKKEIRIILYAKQYYKVSGLLTLQEHQLLTKTFKALGWEK